MVVGGPTVFQGVVGLLSRRSSRSLYDDPAGHPAGRKQLSRHSRRAALGRLLRLECMAEFVETKARGAEESAALVLLRRRQTGPKSVHVNSLWNIRYL